MTFGMTYFNKYGRLVTAFICVLPGYEGPIGDLFPDYDASRPSAISMLREIKLK